MKPFFLFLFFAVSLFCSAHEGENFVPSDMLANMKNGEKAALLMVHFGTTHDDTRAQTIDAINAKVRAAFPGLEFREAYTSRIVIRRLKARGIDKATPLDVLLRLRSEGYTHVIVQSTNIIDGVEMESLRRDVESVLPFFKEIRVGNPLLYSVEDAEKVAGILGKRFGAPLEGTKKKKSKEHVVLVGHGTYTPSTAAYSQMDYMLKAAGLDNFHVGTIEGYPTFETMLSQLKAAKTRSVTLVPFMFVAGDHAKNDIAGDWKEALEKEGYTVNTRLEGLGQVPEIQDIFIEHIRFGLKHRMLGIMEKKAAYAAGKEVK
ncbi:sirohydrochlorin cobaltochelatase [uncultured Bacteroides sp.]|jgi:cbiX|uniref:sirohydrochlorin cobaltochelatase n=1 Tax=uncultured Bacteroides sp. TaxID=162156 RepID=UPI00280BC134|nr:sirohydrochlorin cobaltochelatase [uncultured Bacteroides sp.]